MQRPTMEEKVSFYLFSCHVGSWWVQLGGHTEFSPSQSSLCWNVNDDDDDDQQLQIAHGSAGLRSAVQFLLVQFLAGWSQFLFEVSLSRKKLQTSWFWTWTWSQLVEFKHTLMNQITEDFVFQGQEPAPGDPNSVFSPEAGQVSPGHRR